MNNLARFTNDNVSSTPISKRVQCKTLVHNVRTQRLADYHLAEALNEGWSVLNISVSSAVLPSGEVELWRVVTLQRVIEDDPEPEDQMEAAALRVLGKVFEAPDEAPDLGEPPIPRRIHIGEIIEEPEAVPLNRKPLDEVSYAEAIGSDLYTFEEISQIGNREALAAGLAYAKVMRQQWGKREWTSLRFRLSTPTE